METTSTTAAHTKGPWHLEGPDTIYFDPDNSVAGMLVMAGEKGSLEAFPVARVSGPAYCGREDECDPELLANAEFIVSACNCHDDLLEACQRLVHSLGNRLEPDGEASHRKDDEAMRKGVAAIIKAKEASSKGQGKAAAHLIANPVCNHEDLIDALEVAANVIKGLLLSETPDSGEHQDLSWVLEMIHNALNKARRH